MGVDGDVEGRYTERYDGSGGLLNFLVTLDHPFRSRLLPEVRRKHERVKLETRINKISVKKLTKARSWGPHKMK